MSRVCNYCVLNIPECCWQSVLDCYVVPDSNLNEALQDCEARLESANAEIERLKQELAMLKESGDAK
jgi:hypothetical protein